MVARLSETGWIQTRGGLPWLLLGLSIAMATGIHGQVVRGPDVADEIVFEDFVGADRCGGCHRVQYDAWQGSTHGRAGGLPGPDAVVSEFDGTVLRFKDAVVHLEVDDAQSYLYHVDRPGKARQTFQVAGFVGGGHMLGGGTQTSFARYTDGSWRLLPFDYSRTDDVWFCDVGGRRGWAPISAELALGECRYWPPINNFAPNCGNCHSSQMTSRYDRETQTDHVRFASLAINCESCHGPGRRHAERMGDETRTSGADIAMASLDLLDKEASVEVCMRCHALTQQLAPGYLPGKPFEDYYSVNFFEPGRRHADGRVNGFGYQEAHLSSDCYVNGAMTCVDCHDPHAQGYRDFDRFGLPGKLDDGQCLRCHPSKADTLEAHTGHLADSAGSRCVACHMPFLQHGSIGDAVTFARSDHTIASPRPLLDASLGLETACDSCHADKDAIWQQKAVEDLHGERKPHKPIVSALLALAPAVAERRIRQDFPWHPTASIQMLREAGEMLGLHGSLRQELRPRLVTMSQHRDIDLRALAKAYLIDGAAAAEQFDFGGLRGTAERRRVGAWLEHHGRKALSEGAALQAIAKLEAAYAVDPQPTTALALARVHSDVGDVENALRVLRAAYTTGAHHHAQQLQIVDALCGIFDLMAERGGPRPQSIQRLCEAAARAPAIAQ